MLPEDIGPYRILDKLGEGGIGEVYCARDTRLGRDVAIKVLPAAFTSDPDRLARFEREARTLAALNHPHIAAIYGIEDASGGRAQVLELVEGETLGNRIAHGLKVSDAWRSGGRLPRRSTPRTKRAWCTATSSQGTSS